MYPIYKFELNAAGVTQRAYPIYGDDLVKDFSKEAGEQFFRAKLNGNLTFERDDFTFIVSKAFDTEFGLEIFISYDGGQTWTSYWRGNFWKTDCTFDLDAQTVVVTPTVLDQYTDVLAGLDKEFNLITLAPAIIPVKADKRPMLQIYVPGETVVGCFLSGIWWEQECEAVTDANLLTETYYFGLKGNYRIVELSGNTFPPLPSVLSDTVPSTTNYSITNGDYQFSYAISSYGSNQYQETFSLYFENTLCWQSVLITNNPTTLPATVYLSPVGSASGNVEVRLRDFSIYGRLVMDVASWGGVDWPRLPDNDIVENNRNYHYVSPYFQYEIVISGELVPTPTEWGMYEPGKYYQVPDLEHEYYPVGRSAWAGTSLWIQAWNWAYESEYRKQFVLKDSYPIWSVISVLLGQIAPDITHAGTTDYSQFLYGTNILNITQTLLITPKSNVISAGYDQPAQKAPITLRNVLDMLRDCFRCYWFIDDQNRFRIEHIQYFRKGGSYTDSPVVGIDLTVARVTRNGKPWATARDQYKYDKPEMASRYQFKWMDNVTQLFEGYPIDIVSKFVNPDNIEQITVNRFSSDIDYILLNPSEISKDGFVLMAAVLSSGEYVLPYYNYATSLADHNLQNGYVGFVFLQQYYSYDMPAWYYKVNGVEKTANGVKRLKNQTLNFPALTDPNFVQLIKTNLGNGEIAKLSLGLTTRGANATLNFDIEGDAPEPQSGYAVVFGDSSYMFPANGGNPYTLSVYGIKLENGIEVERQQLSISDVTIVKSGDAPITRSNLIFSASSLGNTETPQKIATWRVTWNAKSVYADFVTTQQATVKNITQRTTTYNPVEQDITWENSGTDIANGQIDYAQFVPSVRIIITQNYTFTSGVSGLEIVSNTLNKVSAVLNIVEGQGLYLFEIGSGENRYYRIEWAQNSTGEIRQGTLRLIYDSEHSWDYAITQAALQDNTTYTLESDPVHYTFEIRGGNIRLDVEGITRVNGVVTSRVVLSANDLTFTSRGDNVATRNGMYFEAADISSIYQDYTVQYWNFTWNAHPIASGNLTLSQMANIFGYPTVIRFNNESTDFEISAVDEIQGWIEYTGPDIVYIFIEEDNDYMGKEVFDDSGMTQGDVIGVVTYVGPLAPFNE